MNKALWGTLKDGRQASIYRCENSNGMSISVSDYGALLVNVIVNDIHGNRLDVALGYDNLSDYELNPDLFGATVAPSSNRIENARCQIDGVEYSLKANDGVNNLHTDTEFGSYKRLWNEAGVSADSVTLELRLQDGEYGLPGNRLIRVRYELTEDNAIIINYEASSDKNTIMNPTNHSYFNLAGPSNGTILDHEIIIYSSNYTLMREGNIVYGDIATVSNTPMDLRKLTRIGESMDSNFGQISIGKGYDSNWILDGGDDRIGDIALAAHVRNANNGITMDTYTDLPGVQLYTGNCMSIQRGKEGTMYGPRMGLCLETQYYPNSPNIPRFPSVIFGPYRDYKSTTIYKFGLI